MSEFQKYNVGENKSGTEKHREYDSTYIKFKTM